MKGFERKRKRYSSSAEECRDRGLKAGDKIVGNEGYGPTVIQITAIGEEGILAKIISRDGKPEIDPRESSWNLKCRDWELVT